jgi:hypothetical protein
MRIRLPSLSRRRSAGRFAGLVLSAAVLSFAVPAVSPANLTGQTSPEADRSAPSIPSDGKLERVVLTNGTVYFGQVVGEGEPLRLELADGEIVEIPRERVASVQRMKGTLEFGEFWPADPNSSRLFFSATGRNLPAGSGSFNAYYGLLPFAAVGVTDRFTIAGGTPLFFGGGGGRLVYLAPKLQVIRTDRVQVGAGVLALHFTGDSESGSYLAYSVATVGSTPHSGVTMGVGLGRTEGRWSSNPALMLGADHRTSKRTKLITENYLFTGGSSSFGLLSGGVRIMGERLSADLALVAPVDGSVEVLFPMVNFSVGW